MIPLNPRRTINKLKLADYLSKHYVITIDPKTGKHIFTLKK